MHKHNRLDFVDTNFLPAIKTNHQEYMEKIKISLTTFINHKSRLAEVRTEKKEKMLKEQLG